MLHGYDLIAGLDAFFGEAPATIFVDQGDRRIFEGLLRAGEHP
jgi:hypothetical protein